MILTPAQSQIAKDRHRFRVVCCGRRFGKTTLAILEMVGKAVSGNDKRVCYIAPTYQQARDIAWQELKKVALPVIINPNESRLEITVKTKDSGSSMISLRGWESIETLRGQRFDLIVIDEIASMRNWMTNWQEVIRPTLTDTRGEVLFISTPRGFNHFYDLYCLDGQDADYKAFHFTSYDNTHLDPLELDKARSELTEDRFAQEYLADFRKTEGLVYKEFSRQKHLYGDEEHYSIETYVGIDWGYTNPCGMLFVERDRDDTYWVKQEYYQRGKLKEEIVEYAASLKANIYYPDPEDAEAIAQLRRKGLNVREVNKDVIAGIDAVRRLFKAGKIRIHRSCVNLINELETYAYKEKKPNQNDPEEPIKENDHLVDSLRYLIFMQQPLQRKTSKQFTPNYTTYGQSRLQSLHKGQLPVSHP